MMDDASPRPVSQTLGDLVDETGARRPTGEAIVFRDELLDYATLIPSPGHFSRSVFSMATGSRYW